MTYNSDKRNLQIQYQAYWIMQNKVLSIMWKKTNVGHSFDHEKVLVDYQVRVLKFI